MNPLKRKNRAKTSSRAPTRRASCARSNDTIDVCPEDFAPATDLLLKTFVGYLLARGCPKSPLIAQLRTAADTLAKGVDISTPPITSRYAYMSHAADVLTKWWTDVDYAGADGNPKPLGLAGEECGLTQLMQTRFPSSKISWAIEWMEEAGLIAQTPDGRYLPRHRSAMFYEQNTFTTERSATLAAQVLATGLHNASNVNNKSAINFDREVRVAHVATKYLLPFRRFVSQQAQGFLEIIDDWLENHSNTSAKEATTDVSVHLYLHTAPEQPAAKSAEQ